MTFQIPAWIRALFEQFHGLTIVPPDELRRRREAGRKEREALCLETLNFRRELRMREDRNNEDGDE